MTALFPGLSGPELALLAEADKLGIMLMPVEARRLLNAAIAKMPCPSDKLIGGQRSSDTPFVRPINDDTPNSLGPPVRRS